MSEKRSIFQEVETRQEAAPAPRRTDPRDGARTSIRAWLLILFSLVVVMIAVGGLTRLTDSGLSITEWAPITGAIPPISGADWLAEFDKYQKIPEFHLVNSEMTLEEFKFIYWWEWGHRQLGRVIGLVWALGFLWFLARKRIPAGWTPRLLGLGVLGGLQGAIGWWMVSSGLGGDMVDVASYRLATHLGLAFLILGLIAWYAFQLSQSQMSLIQARRRREAGLGGFAGVLAALVFAQIVLGALVAGIDAGRTYIDWPLMNGQVLPPAPWMIEPAWRNLFENAGLVQFIHRCWAYGLVILAAVLWWRARGSAVQAVRRGADWVAVAIFGQVVLGIVTLIHASPWQIAILHQLGAVAVFVAVLRARHLALYPPEQRIARG